MTDTVAGAGAAPGDLDPVGEGSTADPPPAVPRPGRTASPAARRRTKRRLLVVFALLVGAVVYLLVEGLGSSLDYFDTVQQAIAHKHKIGTTVIRLEGTVVKGSVSRTSSGADFAISGGDHQIRVVNVGSPPTLFQPTIPVVVVGHFASDRSTEFLSDQIMVKHSATYIAAHPTRVKSKSGKEVR